MDGRIVEWLNSGVGRFTPFDVVMEAMVSDYLVPVSGSLLLVALWFWGRGSQERSKSQAVTITGASAVGIANIINHFASLAFTRTRPFYDYDLNLLFYEPTDSSFPANAGAVGFAIATAVFIHHRRLGVAMYVLAFLWVFGRVYAGVHYPSDALAGAGIGVVAALLAVGMIRLLALIPRGILRALRLAYLA